MPSHPFQSLVSLLSNVLEAYTTAFFITDTKNRMLNLVAVQSLSRYLPHDISLPLEESGILSQVQKVGQMVHMERLHEASPSIASTLPFYREGESHIKGLFAMPVADGAGILYVDTKYGWGFNDKQMKLIHQVAGVLQDILVHESSLGKQEDYSKILDFWNRLKHPGSDAFNFEEYSNGFVEECSKLLDAEYGFVALRDPEDDAHQLIAATSNTPKNLTHQHFLIKQGLLGYSFQTQKPLWVPRMNPNAPDHFLFSPSEGLPHHGTLWAIPARLASGHEIVLAFLSRSVMEWSTECQEAILHMMQFYQLLLDKLFLKEESRHLQFFDQSTGLHNVIAFEMKVEQLLTIAIQHSSPLTLALVQFDPWQMLLTGAAPSQVHRLQKDLGTGMGENLPPGVVLGQVAENRIGLLFPGLTAQEARHHLSNLVEFGQRFLSARLKGIRIQPHLAWAAFPQDATRSEKLWQLVYHRLYTAARSRTDDMSL